MELKEFISDTLVSIAEAVANANTRLTNGAVVHPPETKSTHHSSPTHAEERIEFDVAVYASDDVTTEGSGGIKVLGLNAGGGVNQEQTSGSQSRIQFSLLMFIPHAIREE